MPVGYITVVLCMGLPTFLMVDSLIVHPHVVLADMATTLHVLGVTLYCSSKYPSIGYFGKMTK